MPQPGPAALAAARVALDKAEIELAPGVSTDAVVFEMAQNAELLILRKKELPRVTQAEANRLAVAHERFAKVVESLQERSNPPPSLPLAHNDRNGLITIWDDWLTPYRFEGLPGPPEKHDWTIVVRLLALYEVATGKKVSTSSPDYPDARSHPTMRFLEAAFELANSLALAGEEDLGLQAPPAETIRSHLRGHNLEAIEMFAEGIRKRLLSTG